MFSYGEVSAYSWWEKCCIFLGAPDLSSKSQCMGSPNPSRSGGAAALPRSWAALGKQRNLAQETGLELKVQAGSWESKALVQLWRMVVQSQPPLVFGGGPPWPVELKLLQLYKVGTHSIATAWMSNKLGFKKAICTAYQCPFHRWGWKALKCPFKYLSEQAAAICGSSGSLCSPAPSKAPAAWGEARALAVLYQREPLVHGLSTSWAPFNRKITFLSVPADHELKGWEMMGNVWHLPQKRICQRAHFEILLPRSCCSGILKSC